MLPVDDEFGDLIRRIRAGDERAAEELVRTYEPEIRREARFRMKDPSLKRMLDSVDITQSVLGSFFVRATLGQYDLERPEQLLRLLVSMTRNKVTDAVRRGRTQSRDVRLERSIPEGEFASKQPTPSRIVALNELLTEFRARLSPEERRLAELRDSGCPWSDIAEQLGGTPEARRKQLARAVDRIAHDLGVDEDFYDE